MLVFVINLWKTPNTKSSLGRYSVAFLTWTLISLYYWGDLIPMCPPKCAEHNYTVKSLPALSPSDQLLTKNTSAWVSGCFYL